MAENKKPPVEAPPTVPMATVEATKFHSYNGRDYQAGDRYEIAADLVDSVVSLGMARRIEKK